MAPLLTKHILIFTYEPGPHFIWEYTLSDFLGWLRTGVHAILCYPDLFSHSVATGRSQQMREKESSMWAVRGCQGNKPSSHLLLKNRFMYGTQSTILEQLHRLDFLSLQTDTTKEKCCCSHSASTEERQWTVPCFLVCLSSGGWVWRLEGRSQERHRTPEEELGVLSDGREWEELYRKGGCRMGGKRRKDSLEQHGELGTVLLIAPRHWTLLTADFWGTDQVSYDSVVLAHQLPQAVGSLVHRVHTSLWHEFTHHSWRQATMF